MVLGRSLATALEAQVKGAWGGGNMGATGKDGAPSMDEVCANLQAIEGYATKFQAVFGEACTPDNVAKAVASFMRTIIASDSAWVRFRQGDESALSEDAKKGYDIFANKAKCTNCHDGLLMTDMQFHNVGIGCEGDTCSDVGRQKVSGDESDTGAFKTPTLFDVAESGPYFHDGSVATLEEAVHLMASGGNPNKYLDETNLEDAKNANITPEEEALLVAFLKELGAEYHIEKPTLPKKPGFRWSGRGRVQHAPGLAPPRSLLAPPPTCASGDHEKTRDSRCGCWRRRRWPRSR